MPIDVSQFLPTFLDETLEMLQQMENALLDIEVNNPDPEKINLIFRVVHSTKSGSAAFGLNDMQALSHALENLLQRVRDKKHRLNNADINLFFLTIDCLRTMIESLKKNQTVDPALAKKIMQQASEAIQEDEEKPEVESKKVPVEKVLPSNEGAYIFSWNIQFTPEKNLLETRNDPGRVFTALKKLGECTITANIDEVPTLDEIEPTLCYLKWSIDLNDTTSNQHELEDIFKWITNPSTLRIQLKKKIEQEKKPQVSAPLQLASNEPSGTRSSVRVATDKIDLLMNTIGELVVTKSMLNQVIQAKGLSHLEKLQEVMTLLERNTRELQEGIMQIRMVPVSFAFERIPRLVHTNAENMKKKIELVILGEETELDKIVMEKITDPILHLVRNAVDHGIELPHVREKLKKNPIGKITLNAYQEGSNIMIEVRDDGAGINKSKIQSTAIEKGLISSTQKMPDEQIYQLIFQPGFSTKKNVSDVSGRGVGLDVVYRNVISVGGNIDIQSTPEVGSVFRLRIPLTLAIMDCQVIKVNDQSYIIPLNSITELVKIDPANVSQMDQAINLYHLRENYIPMIYLRNVLYTEEISEGLKNQFLIVIAFSNKLYGFVCDKLLAQDQVVIKNIEENYHKVHGISGAAVLGDGSIAYIVDIGSITTAQMSSNQVSHVVGSQIKEIIPQEKLKRVDSDQEMQFLSFFIEKQAYAINIQDIVGIEILGKITPLPNVPPYIKGMINLHGTIVPVVNLKERFGLGKSSYNSNTPIIVLNIILGGKKKIIGVVVDAMSREFTIYQKEIKPPPENDHSNLLSHVLGIVTVQGRMVTLLKVDYFIDGPSS